MLYLLTNLSHARVSTHTNIPLFDKGRSDTRLAVIHGTDEGKDRLLRHSVLFII
jgi:hypothetical protein